MWRISGLLAILLFVACGGPGVKRNAEVRSARIPVAILVDKTVDGLVLGLPLRNPSAVVTDFRHETYLCDEGNNRIIKFDTSLTPIIDRGGFGNQPGLFNRPRAMSIDNQLNLWICDAGNRRLVRLDGRLNFVDEIPFTDDEDPFKFGEPSGITVTDYGALWVSDLERDRVAVFDNVGNFDKFVGDFGAGGGPVQDPEGCATDNDGRFYICDGGNSRVMVYDEYGNDLLRLTDDEMILPVAVVVDLQKPLWILDKLAGRLFCFDHDGRNLAVGGIRLIGPASEDALPCGMSQLNDSTLLISDASRGRLLSCRLIYK